MTASRRMHSKTSALQHSIKKNALHNNTQRRTPQKRVSAATKNHHTKNTKKELRISCTASTQKQKQKQQQQQRSKTAW
jgi:hypothetical protein